MGKKTKRKKPGHQKYPWNEWLKKAPRVLKKGRDFNCSTKIMSHQIWNAATRRKLKASLQVNSKQIKIVELTAKEDK